MKRPKIPDSLSDAIEDIYEEAGYNSQSEFVRDAVRHHLETVRNNPQTDIDPMFIDRIVQNDSGLYIGRQPAMDEPITVNMDALPTRTVAVTGDIGSGKTAALELLATRLLDAYDDLQVFIIDPLESYTALTKHHGGERIVLDGNVALNPLVSIAGNEHENPDAANHAVATNFFDDAITDQLDEFERQLLHTAVDTVVTSAEDATVQAVIDTLHDMIEFPSKYVTGQKEQSVVPQRAAAVIAALRPFTANGELENLTRPSDISMTDSRVTYLDLGTGISDHSPTLHAALTNAYSAAIEHSGPSLIIIDELHYAIQSDPLARTLNQLVRHSRHYETSFFFADQPVDSTGNRQPILDNASLRLYLRTEEADVYKSLNDREQSYVQTAVSGNTDRPTEALMCVAGHGIMPVSIGPRDDDERSALD